ncbi:hypothetical protein GCM10008955_34880 [Deinococcus malanensis]|uniref:Uncharacterized protein n=1 Tax=Deinococcus malanensis TaxID=1706855 RepID=A0ABQ2F0S6_9DEIO|nr:hypothetical protein GCM10008955_34880 [Deinococcus malanensis]
MDNSSPASKSHQSHADFNYKGTLFSFRHLNGFDHVYEWTTVSGTTLFDVRIEFEDHCFTEGLSKEDIEKKQLKYDRDAVVSETRHHIRLFDLERYELSKALPGLVRDMIEAVCYFGDPARGNYFSINVIKKQRYVIFFRVYRAGGPKGRLTLTIQSAHTRPGFAGRESVKLGLVLRNTLHGRDTRPPHNSKKAKRKRR